MRIKLLEKPRLPGVKMICDEVIDPRLEKYEMVKTCWSMNSFNVVVGRMGSGKTSLLTSLVKSVFKKCFESIYVFMPPNSRASIENDIFGKNLPADQLYDTLTADNIHEVYDTLQENSNEGWNSLLIIDDFQSLLKDKEIQQVLQKIVTKMRHLRCTIFLLQQNFQALPKHLRELTTNLITFNVGKSQLQKIFDETIPLDKDLFNEIVKTCFKEPHDWICINYKYKKLYKKFDEIILDDDSDDEK